MSDAELMARWAIANGICEEINPLLSCSVSDGSKEVCGSEETAPIGIDLPAGSIYVVINKPREVPMEDLQDASERLMKADYVHRVFMEIER